MTEPNEYHKQGNALRKYVFERIGEGLFAERRKRGYNLTMVAARTNITLTYLDKAETGTGKSRWTILAILLKYYRKQLKITLVDIPKDPTPKNPPQLELYPESWTIKKVPGEYQRALSKWHRRSASVILFKFH